VSADPDVCRIPLLPRRDRFVVLASDGLWDVMTDADAVGVASGALRGFERRRKVLLELEESEGGGGGAGGGGGGGGGGGAGGAGASSSSPRAARVAADALLHEALRRGTLDNVTVVVMLLDWREEEDMEDGDE
jgi:serine/threonine protein phosphatase PrpC